MPITDVGGRGSPNRRFPPEVSRVRIERLANGRVQIALLFNVEHKSLVSRVRCRRRWRRAESGDILQAAEGPQIDGLRSIRQGGTAGRQLVYARVSRPVDVVDKVGDLVVGALVRDLQGCLPANACGLDTVGGRGINADRAEHGFQGGIDGRVQARAVVEPVERVVRRVRDGELLEGEALLLAVHRSQVYGTVDDGGFPTVDGRLKAADESAVDKDGGLIDPVRA